MVLPLIAAGIGAAGSIFSGIMGSKAQDKANAQNYQIALMNYYAQQERDREARFEAQRQEQEGKLGTTSASGTRTYFKPGVGWVTELGPRDKEREEAYALEEAMQLNRDIPLARAQRERNYSRQGREDVAAGGLLQAIMRNYRRDPSQAVGRRNRMTAEAANEGFDTALTQAMVDAARTGSGGQAKIASQLGRDKYKALRSAFMENAEGATEAEENRFMTEQGNLANLYNTMATRASAEGNAAYNPRNIEGMAATQLGGAMQAGRGASENLLRAFSSNPAQFNYKAEPNFGMANTIAQAGSTIAGGLNYYDSTRANNQSGYGNYARQNYFPSAPSGGSGVAANMYKGNVGLF